MPAILAALGTLIAPLESYAEQKLASIGAAFLSAMSVILNGFTTDQRDIAANVTDIRQAKYHAAIAAVTSPTEAIAQASTASLNEFFNEEKADLSKVATLTVSALEVSVTNSLNS